MDEGILTKVEPKKPTIKPKESPKKQPAKTEITALMTKVLKEPSKSTKNDSKEPSKSTKKDPKELRKTDQEIRTPSIHETPKKTFTAEAIVSAATRTRSATKLRMDAMSCERTPEKEPRWRKESANKDQEAHTSKKKTP